ncbi:hypothetical protein BJ508DRAFT_372714 [Ascobolus immersus RN42]|uniref:Uncharacterized protein n=1 Tax=Ascobolus immersus RN42 TaxID=1160509 RepID=A0A3N4INZ3_ASCIM|nr:hypothetical protein BJ508DRAFT_372714 [Ascobolus immersus RN42]
MNSVARHGTESRPDRFASTIWYDRTISTAPAAQRYLSMYAAPNGIKAIKRGHKACCGTMLSCVRYRNGKIAPFHVVGCSCCIFLSIVDTVVFQPSLGKSGRTCISQCVCFPSASQIIDMIAYVRRKSFGWKLQPQADHGRYEDCVMARLCICDGQDGLAGVAFRAIDCCVEPRLSTCYSQVRVIEQTNIISQHYTSKKGRVSLFAISFLTPRKYKYCINPRILGIFFPGFLKRNQSAMSLLSLPPELHLLLGQHLDFFSLCRLSVLHPQLGRIYQPLFFEQLLIRAQSYDGPPFEIVLPEMWAYGDSNPIKGNASAFTDRTCGVKEAAACMNVAEIENLANWTITALQKAYKQAGHGPIMAAKNLLRRLLKCCLFMVAREVQLIAVIDKIGKVLGKQINRLDGSSIAITMAQLVILLDHTGRPGLEVAGGDWCLAHMCKNGADLEKGRERLYKSFEALIASGLDINAFFKGDFAFPPQLGYAENRKRVKTNQEQEHFQDSAVPSSGPESCFEPESFGYSITYACYYRNPRLVRFLLRHGARVNILSFDSIDDIPATAACAFHTSLLPTGRTTNSDKCDTDPDEIPKSLKDFTVATLETLDILKEANPWFPLLEPNPEVINTECRGCHRHSDSYQAPWGTLLESFSSSNTPWSELRRYIFTKQRRQGYLNVHRYGRNDPVPTAWKHYYVKSVADKLLDLGVEPSRDCSLKLVRQRRRDDILMFIVRAFKPDDPEEESLRLWLLKRFFTGGADGGPVKLREGLLDVNMTARRQQNITAISSIVEEFILSVMKPEYKGRYAVIMSEAQSFRLSPICVDEGQFPGVEKSEAWEVMEYLMQVGARTGLKSHTRFSGWRGGKWTPVKIARQAGWEKLVDVLEKGRGLGRVRREYDEGSDEEDVDTDTELEPVQIQPIQPIWR